MLPVQPPTLGTENQSAGKSFEKDALQEKKRLGVGGGKQPRRELTNLTIVAVIEEWDCG